MSDESPAVRTLIRATGEYSPRVAAPDRVLLEKLGLHVRVRPLQTDAGLTGALFIVMFDASTVPSRSGAGVTCVGLGTDPEKAAADAVAQWCLGVLPVLALWRGEHSCLAGTAEFETPASPVPLRFGVFRGGIVERGEHDGGPEAAPSTGHFLALLAEPLHSAGLRRRPHWLECFAIRSAGGSIDATCRLDNRDWKPGQRLLVDDAARWPGTTPTYHSRRQFLLLIPGGEERWELTAPSFWSRLLGRA
jgi:hypothetical protein